MPETSGSTPAQQRADQYAAQGPNGGLADTQTHSRIVPALLYTNLNPLGAPYVKFDNFELLPNGNMAVIDSKTSIVAAPNSAGGWWITKPAEEQMKRQDIALRQNPKCTGFWDLPDAAQAAKAKAILQQLDVDTITVRVRPWR